MRLGGLEDEAISFEAQQTAGECMAGSGFSAQPIQLNAQ